MWTKGDSVKTKRSGWMGGVYGDTWAVNNIEESYIFKSLYFCPKFKKQKNTDSYFLNRRFENQTLHLGHFESLFDSFLPHKYLLSEGKNKTYMF